MKDSDYREKRAFPRFAIRIPVTCVNPGTNEILRGETHDISTEGIGIITYRDFPRGTSLLIYLNMTDNGEEIRTKGKVVWSDAVDSTNFRLGIELEERKLKPIHLILRTMQTLIK